MSLKKYESEVKHLAYSDVKVYSVLSDLSNLGKLRTVFDDAEKRAALAAQFGEEKTAKIEETLKNIEFSADSVAFEAPMAGKVTLGIVEREEPKLVKIDVMGLPVKSNVWIQLLPESSGSCKMKVTCGVEVNFFIKAMADKYVAPGVNKMADMLAALPYDKI